MALIILKRGVGSETHRVESAREVHDPYSVKTFKERYQGAEHILKGGEIASDGSGGTHKPLNTFQQHNPNAVGDLRYHMKRAKQNYERGCPVTLTPNIRNALWGKLKVLKDKVTVGMVPRREMHPVKIKQVSGQTRTVVDYDALKRSKAVERNMQWEDRNKKDLREIKRILRVLEPEGKTNIVEHWRQE